MRCDETDIFYPAIAFVCVDLLHRFHGWGTACTIIARSSIAGVNRMNQVRTSVSMRCTVLCLMQGSITKHTKAGVYTRS